MGNTAYVITDGSHDKTLKVGGVAGKIVMEGDSEVRNFQQRIFNAYDSTVVEYLAIEESLKVLRGMQKKGAQIDHIIFATDSLALMCAVDPQQVRDKFPESIPYIERSKRYHKLNEKLISLTKEMGVSFNLQKVKAHVPDNEASTLEKIHNQVDLMAKEPKDRVVEAIKYDSLKKSKTFSVMIPNGMSDEALEKTKSASLALIRQGYSPRVLLQEGAKNPMVDVIATYQDDMGEGAANEVRKNMRVVTATEKVTDNAVSISGLNRSRARHWISKEGGNIDEWALNGYEGAIMNDIMTSTLGNSYPLKVIGNPEHKGRLAAKPCELILHHGEEKLMPEHLDMLTRAVKVYGLERKLVSQISIKPPEIELDLPSI
jgi:ribonuclease HI